MQVRGGAQWDLGSYRGKKCQKQCKNPHNFKSQYYKLRESSCPAVQAQGGE